jgi:putative hemolysin
MNEISLALSGNRERIELDDLIKKSGSDRIENLPAPVKKAVKYGLSKILRLKSFNGFLAENYYKSGIDFIEAVFDHLNFTYKISSKSVKKIPHEGRLIIVANHPLGGLDGLSLIHAVYQVRSDVKVVVNDMLMELSWLKDFFLPYNIFSHKAQRINVKRIEDHLNSEGAVIFFPSAEVSRFGFNGVNEAPWQKGAYHFSKRANCPVLPVFIKGFNSPLFYALSSINKNFSYLLLPSELFGKRNRSIEIVAGDHISSETLGHADQANAMKLLKKHTYRIGQGRKGIFKTQTNIIHPVSKSDLKKEADSLEAIGTTTDGKKIFVAHKNSIPRIMKEISRLREATFRAVGEGTGKNMDYDKYDNYYDHIILWDDALMEVVGSYRVCRTSQFAGPSGSEALYNSTLFRFKEDFNEMLLCGMELGRSFVQKKYWNTFALDYLWQGIGAYASMNKEIKYLFGAVSLSKSISNEAKDLIIYFYDKWYGKKGLTEPKNPYRISMQRASELDELFIKCECMPDEYKVMKETLKIYGYSVPVLFNQYTKLCDNGGVYFTGFNTDPDFSDCVDGFIVVETDKISEKKKERYFKAV